MEHGKLTRQMIEFNRTAFTNTFNAIIMLQDQTEQMVRSFMDKAPWIPEEGKKSLDEWVKAYKKGREEYKRIVDDGFKKLEELFIKGEKAAASTKEKSK
jgi:polyhydroxyalkanoate synthesis regulator phasin